MSEERSQINVKVPRETKELAKKKLEHGGLSRVMRRALEREIHGNVDSKKVRVKDELERLRDEREELRKEKSGLERDISDLDRKIERLENKLDNIRDKEGEYEGALQIIEGDKLENGKSVFPSHDSIQNAANLADCSPEDVIQDLKERNEDIPDDQFEYGHNVNTTNYN